MIGSIYHSGKARDTSKVPGFDATEPIILFSDYLLNTAKLLCTSKIEFISLKSFAL